MYRVSQDRCDSTACTFSAVCPSTYPAPTHRQPPMSSSFCMFSSWPMIGLGRPQATSRAGISGSGPKLATPDGDIGDEVHVQVEMSTNSGIFETVKIRRQVNSYLAVYTPYRLRYLLFHTRRVSRTAPPQRSATCDLDRHLVGMQRSRKSSVRMSILAFVLPQKNGLTKTRTPAPLVQARWVDETEERPGGSCLSKTCRTNGLSPARSDEAGRMICLYAVFRGNTCPREPAGQLADLVYTWPLHYFLRGCACACVCVYSVQHLN